MSDSKYIFPKRIKTSYEGEATKGRSPKPRGFGAEQYRGLPKKRASDGAASQWLLLYPLRPSIDTDLIRGQLRAFGACRTVRSVDGYYALCEYETKPDAVEAKSRLHHSREPWVLRKEHATGYWADKAATGLKIDSVSRPKALECLAKLGFPDVDGGWDSVLLKPKKGPRISDFYRQCMTRIYEAEERAQQEAEAEAKRKEDIRRRRREQLSLPEYDSFDEDFDLPAQLSLPDYDSFDEDLDLAASAEDIIATRKSKIRSQLGLPAYDSFDEDF